MRIAEMTKERQNARSRLLSTTDANLQQLYEKWWGWSGYPLASRSSWFPPKIDIHHGYLSLPKSVTRWYHCHSRRFVTECCLSSSLQACEPVNSGYRKMFDQWVVYNDFQFFFAMNLFCNVSCGQHIQSHCKRTYTTAFCNNDSLWNYAVLGKM